MTTFGGGMRLFRLFGIDVYLHWTWAIVAYFELQSRQKSYGSPVWNLVEYLTLFVIVLMHEFGHALACKSTGGIAERIMLWPLGGVAFVQPPPRAGALLWSIVAGPLVNVALLPVTFLALRYTPQISPDVDHFILTIFVINLVLLIFNLLPIYPLDGGQIVRALLWFLIGPAKSLLVAAIIGLFGIAGGLAFTVITGRFGPWLGVLAVFAAMQCWTALGAARAMLVAERGQVFFDPERREESPFAPSETGGPRI